MLKHQIKKVLYNFPPLNKIFPPYIFSPYNFPPLAQKISPFNKNNLPLKHKNDFTKLKHTTNYIPPNYYNPKLLQHTAALFPQIIRTYISPPPPTPYSLSRPEALSVVHPTMTTVQLELSLSPDDTLPLSQWHSPSLPTTHFSMSVSPAANLSRVYLFVSLYISYLYPSPTCSLFQTLDILIR